MATKINKSCIYKENGAWFGEIGNRGKKKKKEV
jgi:hypothetical protein